MLRPATEVDRDAVLALGVAEEENWFGQAESSAGEVGEWVDEEAASLPVSFTRRPGVCVPSRLPDGTEAAF